MAVEYIAKRDRTTPEFLSMVLLLFEFYSSLNFAFSWIQCRYNEMYNNNYVNFRQNQVTPHSFTEQKSVTWNTVLDIFIIPNENDGS